jgi:hypothetical protein
MYEPPADERPGCRETLILTRAAFAVLIPVLVAMIAIVAIALAVLLLLFTHPVLALLLIAAVAAGIVLFARWERGRSRPPVL